MLAIKRIFSGASFSFQLNTRTGKNEIVRFFLKTLLLIIARLINFDIVNIFDIVIDVSIYFILSLESLPQSLDAC